MNIACSWTAGRRGNSVVALLVLLVVATRAGALPWLPDGKTTPADTVLKAHIEAVHALTWFSDGSRFVSASRDGTVKVFDAKTFRTTHTIRGHDGAVFCVAVSEDGALVATGGADHTVRLWDTKSWDQVGQLEGHTGEVRGVAFVPGGRLVSGGGDGVRLWSVADEKLLWKWGGQTDVRAMSLSHDRRRLALIDGFVGSCKVLDLTARTELGTYGDRATISRFVAISPDGTNLFVGDGPNDEVSRYDVDTKKPIPVSPEWRLGRAFSAVFSPDGKRVVVGWNSGQVQVWDLETREIKQAMRTPTTGAAPDALAVSPDGKTLLVGTGGIDTAHGWNSSAENVVAVYPLGDKWLKPQLGAAAAGGVSWTTIPLRIKTLDGQTTRFEDLPESRRYGAVSGPIIRRLTNGADAWLTQHAIYLHHGGGVMEETLVDEKAAFNDIAWDGQGIWVADSAAGATLVKPDGKTVIARGPLPPCKAFLRFFPLSPGKVLAVGTDGKNLTPEESWCAILERRADAIETKVFFKSADHPVDWLGPALAPSRERPAKAPTAAFAPAWFTEPPDAPRQTAGDRKIWLMVRCDAGNRFVVLNVDRMTAAVAPLPRSLDDPETPLLGPSFPPCWLDGRQCLLGTSNIYLATLKDHDALVDASAVLIPFWSDYAESPLLPVEGRFILPGERWYAIGQKPLEVTDLGRGVRASDGSVVRGHFFISGCIGMAALDQMGKCLYRISVNPAHPLADRATLDAPPPVLAQATAEGSVLTAGDEVRFIGPDVMLHFNRQGGNLITSRWEYGFARADEAEFQRHEREQPLIWHLKYFAEARRRAGLTTEQAARLIALPGLTIESTWAPAQVHGYEALFHTYRDTPAGPQKDAAAKALLDIVVAESRPIAKRVYDYNRQVEAIVPQSQLLRVEYKRAGGGEPAPQPAGAGRGG